MSTNTVSESEMDRRENVTVNLFVGLPGSGKTTACKIVEDAIENESVESHEVSDYVRHLYEDETGNPLVTDNALGRWAAEKKDEFGNAYFVRNLAEELATPYPSAENINISGVRSPEEADAVREMFDNVRIISIWTLPDIRYERLQEREGEYTAEEFNERKERELWDWGCIEFFANEQYYDHIVPNNWGLQSLESNISAIIGGADLYTEEPWPADMPTKEHIAQYL